MAVSDAHVVIVRYGLRSVGQVRGCTRPVQQQHHVIEMIITRAAAGRAVEV